MSHGSGDATVRDALRALESLDDTGERGAICGTCGHPAWQHPLPPTRAKICKCEGPFSSRNLRLLALSQPERLLLEIATCPAESDALERAIGKARIYLRAKNVMP